VKSGPLGLGSIPDGSADFDSVTMRFRQSRAVVRWRRHRCQMPVLRAWAPPTRGGRLLV